MPCPWCHTETTGDTAYCGACGRTLPARGSASPWAPGATAIPYPPGFPPPGAPPPWLSPPPPLPTGSGRPRILLITLAVLVVMGIIVFVVLSWGAGAFSPDASATRRLPSGPTDHPAVGEHWHIAFGIFLCDHFTAAPEDTASDVLGIHTHGDGIIHVHPFTTRVSGPRATLRVFGDQVGITFGASGVTLPAGSTGPAGSFDGETCGGRPGHWLVREWSPDDPAVRPTTFLADLGSVKLDGDRRAMTLAFVAQGDDVPEPQSVPYLDRLSDAPATTQPTI